jgi:hypothetical protein
LYVALQDAINAEKGCNGEKGAMAGHLRKCVNATPAETALAAKIAPTKSEQKAAEKRKLEKTPASDGNTADDEASGSGERGAKRKKVEKSFTQSKLEVFRGLDILFSEAQKEAIHEQFLRDSEVKRTSTYLFWQRK